MPFTKRPPLWPSLKATALQNFHAGEKVFIDNQFIMGKKKIKLPPWMVQLKQDW